MLKQIKRGLSTALVLATMFTTLSLSSAAFAADPSETKIPNQIGLAMTSEPTSSISINWTTIDTTLTNPIALVWQANKKENSAVKFDAQAVTRTVSSSTISGVTQKNFYSVTIDGLKANIKYNYRIGTEGAMSEVHSFETAPANNGKYTFIYFSDSQCKDAHAKGWQANLDAAEEFCPNAKFLYIAGDLTDTANNEGQWESFFNEKGNVQHNDKFNGDFISELPVAAAMGNHDAAGAGIGGMCSHYTWQSDVSGVPVCYAFDYGAARMIILNLENAYSMNSATLRQAQYNFLADEVAQAKKAGQWVMVGFHKSLYSGADHMDDADVINNREYWAPKFADLDVDVVLQGHDHVLSRGFINKDGYKVDVTRQINDREFMAKDPDHAPLYYDGNTASSLKFYAPIMNNSWITPGDPVAPDFGYLDINSALPAGYTNADGELLNPGPCTNDELDGTPGFFRTPTFTSITVTKGRIEFNTYMTGFDPSTNSIVEDTFLYDSLKVTR